MRKTRIARLIICLVLICFVAVFAIIYFTQASLVTGNAENIDSLKINKITADYQRLAAESVDRENWEALFAELARSDASKEIGDEHTFQHDPAFEILITYSDGRVETILPTENLQSLYRVVVAPDAKSSKLVYVISENEQLVAQIMQLLPSDPQ